MTDISFCDRRLSGAGPFGNHAGYLTFIDVRETSSCIGGAGRQFGGELREAERRLATFPGFHFRWRGDGFIVLPTASVQALRFHRCR